MQVFNLQGVIGQDVHAISLAAFLDSKNAGDSVMIAVNSVGGYVSEGELMSDVIESAELRGVKITTKAVLVASAANLPFLAASTRIATDGFSKFMIHNCWSEVRGNASELAKIAAEQSEIDNRMRNYYEKRTGKNASFFQKYMEMDSEFGAETALLLGFVTKLEKIKAMAMLSAPTEKIDSESDSNFNFITMEKKEKTLKSQILALLGVKNEDAAIPEDFPKEMDAPTNLTDLIAKIDDCMARIIAIEEKIAGNETEIEDVSASLLALAQSVNKASKGAVNVAKLPITDKVPTNVGKSVISDDDFLNNITQKYKLK